MYHSERKSEAEAVCRGRSGYREKDRGWEIKSIRPIAWRRQKVVLAGLGVGTGQLECIV